VGIPGCSNSFVTLGGRALIAYSVLAVPVANRKLFGFPLEEG